MAENIVKESAYTKKIKSLIELIFTNSSLNDSIYEVAQSYFVTAKQDKDKKNYLEQNIVKAQQALKLDPKSDKLLKKLNSAEKGLSVLVKQESQNKQRRLSQVKKVCYDILNLCRGKDKQDTNNKYARILGTIQLMTPTMTIAALNQNKKSKHLYRAILSLILFEQLLADNLLSNKYVDSIRNKAKELDDVEFYQEHVQIPILLTALLLDVGNYHPDALAIFGDVNGKTDEFRTLENDERLALLKVNYYQSLNYLQHGLGKAQYIGNSKEERAEFEKVEADKMEFMLNLLKRSVDPKQGIGNVIKIPQIYISVVLSTRNNFTYRSLAKVFLLLHKGAEKGGHSQVVVNCLHKILGTFPQGFGITYIPKSTEGHDLDRFEYAIVNGLYPSSVDIPICRVVTKNLTFSSAGNDTKISPGNNLYFPKCRKKLEKVSSERLQEILQKLWSNFEHRQSEAEFVPDFWHPHEYFSYSKYQNLWNKNS